MKIVFFQNAAGEAVVLEWIHEQEDKVQAKIFRDLKLLEQYGLSEKTQKTPINEIDKAVKRLTQYREDRKER